MGLPVVPPLDQVIWTFKLIVSYHTRIKVMYLSAMKRSVMGLPVVPFAQVIIPMAEDSSFRIFGDNAMYASPLGLISPNMFETPVPRGRILSAMDQMGMNN
jgi:hypothetical protein